jgi:hypothetical protein
MGIRSRFYRIPRGISLARFTTGCELACILVCFQSHHLSRYFVPSSLHSRPHPPLPLAHLPGMTARRASRSTCPFPLQTHRKSSPKRAIRPTKFTPHTGLALDINLPTAMYDLSWYGPSNHFCSPMLIQMNRKRKQIGRHNEPFGHAMTSYTRPPSNVEHEVSSSLDNDRRAAARSSCDHTPFSITAVDFEIRRSSEG